MSPVGVKGNTDDVDSTATGRPIKASSLDQS